MVSMRLSSIQESPTLKILSEAKRLAAEGLDIIDMGVGEPDFDTPKNIVEAGCNSIKAGETRYCPTNGIPGLRKAIAQKLQEENHLPVSQDDVIVTPGAKMAIFAAIQALIDEGEECVLPGPSWVSYEPCVNFAGGKVTWAEVDEKFMPKNISHAINDKTKLIIVNSPSNPTGAVFDRPVLEEIRDLAVDHDLQVISDEIYEKIIFGQEHLSLGAFPGMEDRTVTVNGFSKAYAMTGWRLGYLTAQKETAKYITRLLSHSVSQTTTFVQRAGLEALTGPQEEMKAMVKEFKARRDMFVEGLRKLGMKCSMPGGAFYVFADVSKFGDGDTVTSRLLKEALISVTPGSAFGPGGKNYLRFSYATSQERLKEALLRMEKILA